MSVPAEENLTLNSDFMATDEIAEAYSPEVSAPWLERADWQPLIDAIGAMAAQQFEWKAETDTIHTYEHRETNRYVHIDSVTGAFYDQQCNIITKEAALAHALRPASDGMAEMQDDPELGAFTRTYLPEQEPESQDSLKRLSDGFSRILAFVKRGDWSIQAGGLSRYPEDKRLAQAHGVLDLHEPSLAMFMRRHHT